MGSLSADFGFRRLIYQVTDPQVVARLDQGGLTAYIGFDPTAESLHVGSLLQLCTLRRLQEGGHRPIALAGGGTGMIGDPGGRASERALLDPDQVAANVAGIRRQLERFVDFQAGAVLLDNAEWLGQLQLIDFLRDIGKHFTVNAMTAKESVRSRLERNEGLSYTEFSYMLLQAYDFLHLHDHHGCRLQVGGSDQWGNITMGVDLVRRLRGSEVWGLTTPLVLKADGTKFGKSEGATVWLDAARTSPYQLYQHFVRVGDGVVGAYLRYFTWLGPEAIAELDREVSERPERREAQRVLAREVTALVHGAQEAARAQRTAAVLFGGELGQLDEGALVEAFADAPSSRLARDRLAGGDGVLLVEALVETGLVPSRSAALRTIRQGGAYVNNRRVDDPDRRLGLHDLLSGRWLVLRRGRRDQHLIVVG